MNQFVKMRGKTFCCLFIVVAAIALASACCDKVMDNCQKDCDEKKCMFTYCSNDVCSCGGCPPKGCTHGDIRLADGPNHSEGRLEVCENGQWGTVCNYAFRYSEAQTVCWQLGFRGANYNKCCYGTYGPGTGNIISALSCSYDKTVLDCERKELNYTCDHSNDVGVRCFDSVSPPECSYGDIKLVGGPNEFEGRVETCDYDNHWGTICNLIFRDKDATVVCRQLGFSDSGAQAIRNARDLYGPSNRSIIVDDPDCSGDENNILGCNTWMTSFSECTYEAYAGVKCQAAKAEWESNKPNYRYPDYERRFKQFHS